MNFNEKCDLFRTQTILSGDDEFSMLMTDTAREIIGNQLSNYLAIFAAFDDWPDAEDNETDHSMGIIPFNGSEVMFKFDRQGSAGNKILITFLHPSEW